MKIDKRKSGEEEAHIKSQKLNDGLGSVKLQGTGRE